ncbi:hypothetical protein FA15DRAFT_661558 [Coprinopsis marcescibilis]|uniref:Uncharacterized protein n=1 Tax=Coprinopsis marcescibilis TaxID=230819 RepID=A0A5C3KB24_COPMA|nr:hypothetical protein FA15DRAFT_661558 [Coprinopsis marcescibilis]
MTHRFLYLGDDSQAFHLPSLVLQPSLTQWCSHIHCPRFQLRGGFQPFVGASLAPLGVNGAICSCMVDESGDNIRIIIKVYPNTPVGVNHHILYRFRKASVNRWLQDHHLYLELEVPVATTINSLMAHTIIRMEASPFWYSFSPHLVDTAIEEDFRLCLLRLVARGVASNRASGDVRLTGEPVLQSMTIQNLLQAKPKYIGLDGLCIETALSPQYTMGGHSCFSTDHQPQLRVPSGGLLGHSDADTSGGEDDSLSESEDSDSDSQAGCHMPVQRSFTQLSVSTPRLQAATIPVAASPAARMLASEGSISIPGFLPEDIWDNSWQPALSTDNRDRLDDSHFPDYIYVLVNQRSATRTLTDCAQILGQKLTEAARSDNYSELLTATQDFSIMGSDNRPMSVGIGIEREAIHLVFDGYLKEGLWLSQRLDDAFSPQILHTNSSPPSSCLIGVKKFGAICLLMMIHGQCPQPLDPCVYQFIAHGCDLRSLHAGFMSEWHPNLKHDLDPLIAVGPNGDLSGFQHLFMSYLQTSANLYCDRNESSHKALVSEILYTAVLGLQTPYLPEWKAFISGAKQNWLTEYLAPQSNFCWAQIIRNFIGGSESFLSLTWTRRVQYEALKSLININVPPGVNNQLQEAGVLLSFHNLFHEFLQEMGAPVLNLWDEISGQFSGLVDLSAIQSPKFRSRCFVWAATGQPFLDDAGLISPTSDLIRRISGLDGSQLCYRWGVPISFKAAFAHWCLSEFVNAIGGHSIL